MVLVYSNINLWKAVQSSTSLVAFCSVRWVFSSRWIYISNYKPVQGISDNTGLMLSEPWYFTLRSASHTKILDRWTLLLYIASKWSWEVIRKDSDTSNCFQAHHKASSILHELTISKTLEQNQQLNCTLVKTAIAIFLDAPHQFWAEAISTATNLRNRSTMFTVKGATAHQQAWYSQKPPVNPLMVFGCMAYMHTSLTPRPGSVFYSDAKMCRKDTKSMTLSLRGSSRVEVSGLMSKRWKDHWLRKKGLYNIH